MFIRVIATHKNGNKALPFHRNVCKSRNQSVQVEMLSDKKFNITQCRDFTTFLYNRFLTHAFTIIKTIVILYHQHIPL